MCWPESVHDATTFANSVLYSKVSVGEILQGSSLQFHASEIPGADPGAGKGRDTNRLSCSWLGRARFSC